MIWYVPGHYHLTYACIASGSVIPKSLLIGVPSGIITVILHRLMRTVWYESFGLEEPAIISVLMQPSEFGAYIISSFLFVLGFLIVFRVNTAYSRWWEGASLLLQVRGNWCHAFSSCMTFCTDREELAKEVHNFRHQMLRMMSLQFGVALAELCCLPESSMEIIDVEEFDQEHLKYLGLVHNKAEVVMQWIQKLIAQAAHEGIIEAPPPILTSIYHHMFAGTNSLVVAQKMTEFPLPFPVAQMISFCLWFQACITIIVGAVSIASEGWAGMVVFLVITCMWGINYIAVELEIPFSDGPNDLPIFDKQKDMNASLLSLVHPWSLTAPKFGIQLQPDRESEHEISKCTLVYTFDEGTLSWAHHPQDGEAHKVNMHSHPVPAHFQHPRRVIGRHQTLIRNTSKQRKEAAAAKKEPKAPSRDASHNMSNAIDAAPNKIDTLQHESQDPEAVQGSLAEEQDHIGAESDATIHVIIPQESSEDGVVL